jgi:hypothetical protein
VSREPLGSRLLIGAIAGIVGTAAMTATMRRLHRKLPASERYPLPPREITDAIAPATSEAAAEDRALAGHFAFGAAGGALLTAPDASPSLGKGMAEGLAVWAASYMGWIPAAGILKPVTRHPVRRTALMIAAHLVWGAATALTARELSQSRSTILRPGEGTGRDRETAKAD